MTTNMQEIHAAAAEAAYEAGLKRDDNKVEQFIECAVCEGTGRRTPCDFWSVDCDDCMGEGCVENPDWEDPNIYRGDES